MKNGLFALSAICLLTAVSAHASDGTINFNGEIVDTACTIDIGASNTMDVTLGKVAKSAFTGVDSTASATEFDLKLTDCPAGNATVKFDGANYGGDNEVLALTAGTGVATGVGIQIKDSVQKVVPLFTASSSIVLTAGENTLPFYASYIQKDAAVVSGKANSTAQFTLNYN